MSRPILALAALALVVIAQSRAGDWPQFRGPNASGIGVADLPERWGPNEGLRWKAELPGRGLSGAVIAGGRVFLTANSGLQNTRLHVLALDADTGQKLWERQFWATGQTLCHPITCMAAATPVTDGKYVYALFASCDLVCLDADGNVVWLRSLSGDYPLMTNHVGRAASPVLADGVLVVPMENQGASYILGIDTKTGKNLWKAERGLENNFTTPVVMRRLDRAEVLVQSPKMLTALEPGTGKTLWSYEGELSSIPSPGLADGTVLALQLRGMAAVKPGPAGKAEVVWQSSKLASTSPSPLVSGGKVYVVKGEILVCGDVADGKVLWDLRLKGPYWASPVLVGDRLYLTNEDGVTAVVRLGMKGELVTTNDLQDKFYATPAVANGALYQRSDKYLYCIAKPNKRS